MKKWAIAVICVWFCKYGIASEPLFGFNFCADDSLRNAIKKYKKTIDTAQEHNQTSVTLKIDADSSEAKTAIINLSYWTSAIYQELKIYHPKNGLIFQEKLFDWGGFAICDIDPFFAGDEIVTWYYQKNDEEPHYASHYYHFAYYGFDGKTYRKWWSTKSDCQYFPEKQTDIQNAVVLALKIKPPFGYSPTDAIKKYLTLTHLNYSKFCFPKEEIKKSGDFISVLAFEPIPDGLNLNFILKLEGEKWRLIYVNYQKNIDDIAKVRLKLTHDIILELGWTNV